MTAEAVTAMPEDTKDMIISMLRAQIRQLGHMPCVVENKEAALADKARIKSQRQNETDSLRLQRDALLAALTELRLTARLLLQNAEGCAVNHYGEDFQLFGPPGWITDCEAAIVEAEAALTASKDTGERS
jgi:hypothetical protein